MSFDLRPPIRDVRLFWRVFAANAAVLVTAGLVLALSPATVSFPIGLLQALVLVAGVAVLLGVNLVLLRRALTAFDGLVASVAAVDPDGRGERVDLSGAGPDVRRIGEAINAMLARIDRERDSGARRRIAAQEDERRRVARDLHDEVGQLITVALLQLDHALQAGPDGVAERIAATRRTLEDIHASVREIASRLRPATLDDLGLANALVTLAESFRASGAADVRADVDRDAVAGLTEEAELAIYRVAQEACTNALRHGRPECVRMRLRRSGDEVILTVADDGCGIDPAAPAGVGMPAMRERAALAGGQLDVVPGAERGTTVSLRLHGGQHPAAPGAPARMSGG